MKNVFILLLLGTASLFCIACSGENSVLTDGDAVLLQPGVHAGATSSCKRRIAAMLLRNFSFALPTPKASSVMR